ncbi:MAG TPA: SMC family ATPase [Gemmatimonadaceae bacterium]|nr:SMC family ATPase [Gemmatimonadaceae bacterium]
MRLHAIRLQNFRQHVNTEIVFESGLTGIIGPNGAGKTTILEAIAFALYAYGRSTREQMISLTATGRQTMSVELEFELGRHKYRILRTRHNAWLFLDGDDSPMAESSTGVTERLQRLLGMSRDEFFRTYFTGQKELALMAAMASSERARFLSKVLGYEKLRVAQDMIAERRRTLNAEISGLRAGMPDPESVERSVEEAKARVAQATGASQSAVHRSSQLDAALSAIRPKWELAQQNRDKVQSISLEITSNEKEEVSLRRNLERVASDLAKVAESRAELSRLQRSLEPMGELREELAILDEMYREEGRRKTLVEGEVALREELDRLRARRTEIARAPEEEEEVTIELEKMRAELETAQGDLEARRTEWVRDRQDADTKLRDLRKQFLEVQAQRERVISLGADGACPTCSRKLGENLQTVVEHLTETEETLRVDGAYYRRRFEQLSEMPANVRELDERRRALTAETGALERKLARVQLAVQELSGLLRDIGVKERRIDQMRRDISIITRGFDAARYDYVKAEIATLAPLSERAARMAALLEREPQLLKEQSDYMTALSSVESLLGTLRVRHRQMSFAVADFDRLKTDYERCFAEARAAELDGNTAAGNLRNAQEALEKALIAAEESRAAQATVALREGERRLHEELDRAFNEMRAQLNAQLRPELSELGTTFLRELMDSRTAEIELDEKYNISVLEDGIAKPVLSGGEEDLANLVLRLAVSQMIAERSGQAFSLLILDEVFGSLDETRRFNVLELLRALGDRFEQVILITHIEAVRDGLDQVVSVRYDASLAQSVVEQSQGGGSAHSAGAADENLGLELEPAGAA